jgi:uncharacterized delta-60 repeat protein
MLLAGSRPSASGGNPGSDFAVVKLTATGQLDTAFGAGGVLTRPATLFPAGYYNACGEFAQGIAIQPDGRILVAVVRYDDCYDSSTQLRVRRFDAAGRNEIPFATESGALTADQLGVGYINENLLRLLDDGRICVFLSVCFTADGGASSLLSGNPFVPPGIIGWYCIAILPGGDALLASTELEFPLRIWRVHRDGNLDTGFGSNGVFAILGSARTPNLISQVVNAFASADGGALYLEVDLNDGSISLVRVLLPAVGPVALDSAFGNQGVAWMGKGMNWFLINDVVEQVDGGLLVATDRGTFRLQGTSVPAPGVLVFSPVSPVSPAGDTIVVTVSRVLGHQGSISLDYATQDDSAFAAVDYRSAAGTLSWADGDTADRVISIPTRANSAAAKEYTDFRLKLTKPLGGTWSATNELIITVRNAMAAAPVPAPAPPPSVTVPVTGGGPSSSGGGGALDWTGLLLLLGVVLWSRYTKFRPTGRPIKFGRGSVAWLLCTLPALSSAVFAAGWQMDAGFAQGGWFPASIDEFALPPAPDGRLVTSASSSGHGTFRGYTPDGQPDPSFGQAGQIVISQSPDMTNVAPLVLPDGHVMFYGSRITAAGVEQGVVYRFNRDGTPDGSFAAAGILALGVDPASNVVALAVQADGRILVLELLDGIGSRPSQLVLLRFNSDGTGDTGFGGPAGVSLPAQFQGVAFVSLGVQVLPNGLVRVQTGSVDFVTLSGNDGHRVTDPAQLPGLPAAASWWRLAAVTRDGDYLLDGTDSAGHLLVTRVHADGTPVAGFSLDGSAVLSVDLSPGSAFGTGYGWKYRTATLGADGQHLYVASYEITLGYESRGRVIGIALPAAGAAHLDDSFGNHGLVDLPQAFALDRIYATPAGALLLHSRYQSGLLRLSEAATRSPGVVGFAHPYETARLGATTRLVVRRSLGTQGAASVKYLSSLYPYAFDTDVSGLYQPVSGQLDWQDGDASDRYIDLPIPSDSRFSGGMLRVGLRETSGVRLFDGASEIQVATVDATLPPQVALSPPDWAIGPPTLLPVFGTPSSSGSGGSTAPTHSATGGGGALGRDALGVLLCLAVVALARRQGGWLKGSGAAPRSRDPGRPDPAAWRRPASRLREVFHGSARPAWRRARAVTSLLPPCGRARHR